MTKEKFEKYEEVRRSGVTNMFSVMTVVSHSDGILDKEDCLDIMENYSKYQEEFECRKMEAQEARQEIKTD